MAGKWRHEDLEHRWLLPVGGFRRGREGNMGLRDGFFFFFFLAWEKLEPV